MKKRIICIATFVAFIALVLPIYAIMPDENSVLTEEYSYIEYDYTTKETSTYCVTPDVITNCTWELFSQDDVLRMTSFAETLNLEQNAILSESSGLTKTSPSDSYANAATVIVRRLIDTDGDGEANFAECNTGFLVSPNVVVTAAHCVILNDPNESLVQVQIYYDAHSSTFSGIKNNYSFASKHYYAYAYTSGVDSLEKNYDYCVIDLASDIERDFYFNCIEADHIGLNNNLRLSGYPEDYNYYQYSSEGSCLEVDDYNLLYNNASAMGMSGGPIYNINYYNCLGVHSGSSADYPSLKVGVLFHNQFYTLVTRRIASNE